MHILDLTDAYCASVLRHRSLTEYRRSYPDLFKHYFRFWAKERYWRAALRTSSAVRRRRTMVMSRLGIIERKLNRAGFDTSDLKLILFVGQNTTNGHAFLNKGKLVIWIPVEAYKSTLQVDVFVTHEILHGLHYSRRPEFYFTTERHRRSVGRQLLTEGFATWASARILGLTEGAALWADYLSLPKQTRWLATCRRREAELKAYVAKHYDTAPSTLSLFYANDPKDVFTYRAGYFAGLRAVQRVSQRYQYGIADIINLSRRRFGQLVKNEYLRKL